MPDMPGAVDDKHPEKMKPGEVPPGPWDPGLFKDDDGQLVPLLGSSRTSSRSTAQKIAFEDGKLIYQTQAEPLFKLHPERAWLGAVRPGPQRPARQRPADPPYVEGAWMTKHGGKYYLQYGAPGTEFNAYANGTYVSRQAARAVHIRAVQSDRLQAGRVRPRRRPRLDLPGQLRQLVEHGHAVDRLQLDLRAADQHVPGQVRGGRPDVLPRRASGTSRNTCRRTKVDDPDSLFTGWMLLSYRKPVDALPRRGASSPRIG